MDVTKEITKEIFEQYVPAAKMPERNTSVFNRMVPYFSRSYQHLQDLLFKDIPTLMDADDLKNASGIERDAGNILCLSYHEPTHLTRGYLKKRQ